MTWHETRARWRILREIADGSHHDPTGRAAVERRVRRGVRGP